ncbi:Maltodextrin-binding protein mdxE precursor [uncultured Ruminococcus sp.]|nr:Maltodextrin-binding protein mdxE precursor [uncultured Ruminococcus sp.]
MKNAKKLTSIVLAALLAAGTFASCGGNENTSGSTGGTDASGDSTKITYLMWGEPTRTDSMQRLADTFHEKHPDITVNIDNAGDNFAVKFNTLMAAGTPPDAALVNELAGAGLYANKFYENIYDLIQSDTDFLNNVYNKVADPVKAPFTMSDNEVFALPTMNYTTLMFYNKDMFDAAGVAYPDGTWDWEDFREAAKKLTVKEGDETSQFGTFFTRMIVYEQSWFFSSGLDVISADRTTCDLNSQEAVDAFTVMQEMIHKDGSAPIPDTTGGSQVSNISFDTGKVAMQLFGSWMIPTYETLPFNWGVAPIPSGPEGRIPAAFPNGMGIGYGTKNKDAAWEWIKFCTSEEGQQIIAEEGLAQPTLESIMDSDAFMKASEKADMSIVKEALLEAKGPNAVARWAEIGGNTDSYLNTAMDRILIYNEDVKTVLDEEVAKCNEVLKEVQEGNVQG